MPTLTMAAAVELYGKVYTDKRKKECNKTKEYLVYGDSSWKGNGNICMLFIYS